jgi:hypothetical protein
MDRNAPEEDFYLEVLEGMAANNEKHTYHEEMS